MDTPTGVTTEARRRKVGQPKQKGCFVHLKNHVAWLGGHFDRAIHVAAGERAYLGVTLENTNLSVGGVRL